MVPSPCIHPAYLPSSLPVTFWPVCLIIICHNSCRLSSHEALFFFVFVFLSQTSLPLSLSRSRSLSGFLVESTFAACPARGSLLGSGCEV
ncbi:hypothetical protein GGS23DRAFT_563634 [Durotheca rogersii]|uniref:uncharacterized protein n=1 Tax=Durotheca rogersii TaxID=419775 RepID=UPI002220C947|nr:uncharacterized protein GGS23DRAFT_563634 [Durotheca rogersii]KAI5864272.1 hypothetical protein GGS23DRAFT_563634 [Durotheca rogersii]